MKENLLQHLGSNLFWYLFVSADNWKVPVGPLTLALYMRMEVDLTESGKSDSLNFDLWASVTFSAKSKEVEVDL